MPSSKPSNRRRFWSGRVTRPLPALLAACSFCGGCGESDFRTAPTAGRVMLDGGPFTTGQVMFTPVAAAGEMVAGPAAIGVLDGDGRFVLGAYSDDDGAVVGKNWVTVINTGQGKGVLKFDRIKLPSGAKEVIAGQPNEFEIELTSEMLRRYARR